MRKAIIAMSGGVDSSVAALLTKETGDECIGATMKLFHNVLVGKLANLRQHIFFRCYHEIISQ